MSNRFSFDDPQLIEKLADLIRGRKENDQVEIHLIKGVPFEQPDIQRIISIQWDANLLAGKIQRSLRLQYSSQNQNKEVVFHLLVGGPAYPDPQFVELTPKATRYFREQIQDQIAYQCVVDACSRLSPEIHFTQNPPLTKNRLDKVLEAVRRDYPEFWFLNFKSGISIQSQGNAITTVQIYDPQQFSRNDLIKMDTEMRSQAKGLLQEIKEGTSSPYEVLEKLYDCITQLVSKDYESEFAHTPYGCLVLRRCDCAGVANAIKLVGDMAGLELLIANEEGFAWNLCRLGNSFYHLDAATDSQSEEYRYMCLDDNNFFIQKKRILSGLTLPRCNSMEFNFHNMHHSRVHAAAGQATQQIENIVVQALKDGRRKVIIFFDQDIHFDTTGFVKNSQLTPILKNVELKTGKKVTVNSISYWEQGIKFIMQ